MSTIGERLAKARARLFGTAAVDIPTPFQIPCDCGHSVAGIRRPRIQIANCSACGKSLFILPVNLYPATRHSPGNVIDGGLAARAAAAARELAGAPDPTPAAKPADPGPTNTPAATNSPASASTTAHTRRTTKRSRTSTPTDTPTAPNTSSADSQTESTTRQPAVTPALAPPRIPLRTRIRRTFTPFRLLTAGCLSLLLLTVAWMVHRQQLETARLTWRREFDAALKAESEHNRTALLQSLQVALAAADRLQKQDSDTDIARSLLQQCTAISQLSAIDPIAVLSTQTAPNRPPDTDQLTSELQGLYLLFDARPQPDPSAPHDVLIDLPLIIHGRLLQLTTSSRLLHQFAQQYPGDSAIFLAAIHSCHVADNGAGPLQLQLDPDSVTLLTSDFLAAEAGLTEAIVPGLPLLLQRQSDLITPPTTSTPESDSNPPADHSPNKPAFPSTIRPEVKAAAP